MRVGPPRTADERADALACLLGVKRADAECRVKEVVSLADRGVIDLSGLVAVWDGGEAVAVTLWCRMADGSAFIWPPEVRPNGRPADAVASLEGVIALCRAARCPFAQSAAEPERWDHCGALTAAGFAPLTDLLCLKRYVREDQPAVPPVDGRLISLTDSTSDRFAALVERTYVASGDCPGFAGYRSAADAFLSYESAGTFTPERWQLVERGGTDVAVILVNEHDDESREIIYLGVVPEVRRRGLGKSLVGAELADARGRGVSVLRASVDVSNVAAVTLYSRLGFFPGERRSIYLMRLSR